MSVDTVRQYFESVVPDLLTSRGEILGRIQAIYEFQITGDEGGTWTLDLKQTPGQCNEETSTDADCTIVMKSSDFIKMINGDLKPQMAFLMGKLKVTGNMGLALKLSDLFS